MTTVTSKAGRAIELTIAKDGCVVAASGSISFNATKTATGFKSCLTVDGKIVEAVLDGAELAKAHAVFAESAAIIERIAAAHNDYHRNYNRVINGMQ